MATVNSVLGPLDTADLGFTLPHEHLIDSSAGIRTTYPELELRDKALEMALESFKEAKNGGVDTVVEVSPMDLGRDVLLMKEVSEETGIQFICCTGCWLDIPRSFWAGIRTSSRTFGCGKSSEASMALRSGPESSKWRPKTP